MLKPSRTDTKNFGNDLIQTIKYKSYVPGAPPPPKPQAGPVPPPPLPFAGPSLIQPPFPTGPAAGGRKRGFDDRGDFNAPNGRDPFQPGGRPSKQPRRGGRRGYVDPDAPQPVEQLQYGFPNAPGQQNAPLFAPTGPAAAMPSFAALNDPMEAMRQQLQQLQQALGMQMGQASGFGQQQQQQQQGFPPLGTSPQKKRGRCRDYDTKGYCARGPNCRFEHSNGTDPMYNLPAPQMSGQIQLSSEGRFLSDFQFAPEDNGCFAFHPALQQESQPFPEWASQLGPQRSPQQLPESSHQTPQQEPFFSPNLSSLGYAKTYGIPGLTYEAEYDPTNANMAAPVAMPHFSQQQPKNGVTDHRRNGRQAQNQRRTGQSRFPLTAVGPVHDRTQTKVVVTSIPEENFDENQVRHFFSQFGNIEEVTMMPYKRIVVIRYDNWNSANAAYKSPKVIFDNRFVKVFWYKDEEHSKMASEETNASKKGAASSGRFDGAAAGGPEEEQIDMEEFTRKQEEAQKTHEEKTRKAQEIEKKRAELEKMRKELQAKQDAEKQRLMAKLARARTNSTDPGANGTDTEDKGGDASKPSQTEALRATLAKLQEEAKEYGLDPNAQADDDATISMHSSYSGYSGYNPRGRGGGSYRGRGSSSGYAPRASYRGGRGRGGDRGNMHAAYAAYSLDNRPRKVALTGADFSVPEKDEALRQHLFSLGEFAAEIQVTPAATHIGFNDRKAAEKFYNSLPSPAGGGNKTTTLPGLAEEVELAWVANTAGPLPGSSTHKVDFTNNANGGQHQHANGGGGGGGGDGGDDFDALMADANGAPPQNGGGQGLPPQQQADVAGGEEDYDVAGENEWDID